MIASLREIINMPREQDTWRDEICLWAALERHSGRTRRTNMSSHLASRLTPGPESRWPPPVLAVKVVNLTN